MVAVMGTSERRKGLRGQQEVQRIVRDAGLTIRKLGGVGDALVQARDGLTPHMETERQERQQPWLGLRQAHDDAPKGAVPVVSFPESKGEWLACLRPEHPV